VTDMDGKCFEGTGISPDTEFIFTGDSEEGGAPPAGEYKDIQIEKVLAAVREWIK